jgi:hypothetical protein
MSLASQSKAGQKIMGGQAGQTAAGGEAEYAEQATEYVTEAQAAENYTEQGEETQQTSTQPSFQQAAVAPRVRAKVEETEETEESGDKPKKKGGFVAWLKSLFVEEAPSGLSGVQWSTATIKGLNGLKAEGMGDLLLDDSPKPRLQGLQGLSGLKAEGLGATAPAKKTTKLKYANIGIALVILAALGLGIVYRKKVPGLNKIFKNPRHRSFRRKHHR